MTDAGRGIAHGAESAGSWAANNASVAIDNIGNAASEIGSGGVPRVLGAVGGFGDVAVAGAAHAANNLWREDGVNGS